MTTKKAKKAKVHVPKKGDSVVKDFDVAPVTEDSPKRSRRQWTANDHRALLLEWVGVAFTLPVKSMISHISKGFALEDGISLKVATEFEIAMQVLIAENAEKVLLKLVKDHDGDVLEDAADIESVD